tara:strand:- start:2060 stop:2284 length:225 start_codon:yes stop_codon:yes gene_type:complete
MSRSHGNHKRSTQVQRIEKLYLARIALRRIALRRRVHAGLAAPWRWVVSLRRRVQTVLASSRWWIVTRWRVLRA